MYAVGDSVFVALALVPALAAQVYRYRSRKRHARRHGRSSTSTSGYSGTGYVNFDNGNSVTVQANVPDGLYELWIGYNSPFRLQGIRLPGRRRKRQRRIRRQRQSAGVSIGPARSISPERPTRSRINRGWGYYNVDYFELRPYTPPALLPVTTQLSDPQASRRTQMLMNYLVSQYGQKTLSGQQGDVGSNGSFPRADYLSKSGGIVPAIRGSDFIEYSPSRIAHGSNPNGETERMINWAKSTGGIPSMMWHWNCANRPDRHARPRVVARLLYRLDHVRCSGRARQPRFAEIQPADQRHRCDRRPAQEVPGCRRTRHLAAAP